MSQTEIANDKYSVGGIVIEEEQKKEAAAVIVIADRAKARHRDMDGERVSGCVGYKRY